MAKVRSVHLVLILAIIILVELVDDVVVRFFGGYPYSSAAGIVFHFVLPIIPLAILYMFNKKYLRQIKSIGDDRSILELHSSIVEWAPICIYLLGEDGSITYANEETCMLMGYDRRNITEMNFTDIDQTFGRNRWRTLANEIRAKRSITFESGHKRSDGSIVPVNVMVNHVSTNGSNCYVVTAEDITDERRAREVEIKFMQAQKMEAIGRLAGGIAHDFNNLLTVIIGNLDMLLLEEPIAKDDVGRKIIGRIHKAATNASNLTKHLLDFTKEGNFPPEELDVSGCVEEFIPTIRSAVGESIEVIFIKPTEPIFAMANSQQLEQVILNITMNSKDAMPSGGSMVVSVEKSTILSKTILPDPRMNTGAYSIISISDTGHGMSDEVLSHLFEPFFTTKEDGTGLGLSSAYGIVSNLGGYITVNTILGGGTTFFIYLPLLHGLRASNNKKLHVNPPSGTEKILVVEDDSDILSIVSRSLSQFGYLVIPTGNARNGICEAMGNQDISLIISDVVLPDGNGPDMVAEIEKNGVNAAVLYMSGYSNGHIHSILGDVNNFLAKPFSVAELSLKVRSAINNHKKVQDGR